MGHHHQKKVRLCAADMMGYEGLLPGKRDAEELTQHSKAKLQGAEGHFIISYKRRATGKDGAVPICPCPPCGDHLRQRGPAGGSFCLYRWCGRSLRRRLPISMLHSFALMPCKRCVFMVSPSLMGHAAQSAAGCFQVLRWMRRGGHLCCEKRWQICSSFRRAAHPVPGGRALE